MGFCTCPAKKIGAGSQCGSWVSGHHWLVQLYWGWRGKTGLRQLESANIEPWGVISTKIFRGFSMTMLAVGFIIAKFLGFSAEQDTENHSHSCCVVDTGSPCPSSLFLVVSRCLSSARLWVGWKQSRSFVQCSERLEKLVTDPIVSFSLFFFPSKGKCLRLGNFLLMLSSAGLGEGMMQTKCSYSPYSFCKLFSSVLCYIADTFFTYFHLLWAV